MASEIARPEDIPKPFFFLSYARQETEEKKALDPYLYAFYKDLTAKFREDMGLRRNDEDIGFLDVEVSTIGDDWANNIREALRKATVMVASYSLSYFSSEYCGKEFYIFVNRQDQVKYDKEGKILNSEKIIPILWSATEPLKSFDLPPKYLRQISYDFPAKEIEPAARQIYLERGLKEIIMKHRKKHYPPILAYLAKTIWQKLVENPLTEAPAIPPLDQAQNVFERHWNERSQKASKLNALPKGPRTVLVRYILPSQPLRTDFKDYYPAPGDWCPFAPERVVSIRALIRELAAERELNLDDALLQLSPDRQQNSTDLLQELRTATKQHLTIVLIADPWALLDDQGSSFFAGVMKSPRWRGGVIIPVHPFDRKTREGVLSDVGRLWDAAAPTIDVEDRPAYLQQFRMRFLEMTARLASDAAKVADVRQRPAPALRASLPYLGNTPALNG